MSTLLTSALQEVENRHGGHLWGPQSEADVRWAEERLQVRFPHSLREFLLRFGGGALGAEEIYGVHGRSLGFLSLVAANERLRATLALPRDALVFYCDGGGAYYHLPLREGPDPAVRAWRPFDSLGKTGEAMADSFAHLLFEVIRKENSQRGCLRGTLSGAEPGFGGKRIELAAALTELSRQFPGNRCLIAAYRDQSSFLCVFAGDGSRGSESYFLIDRETGAARRVLPGDWAQLVDEMEEMPIAR